MNPPTVALVHATPHAMAPALTAFAEVFPQARLRNLLDDTLIGDAEAAGGVTGPLEDRMHELIRYALATGADGVLLSCSMYGPVTGLLTDEAGGRPVLSPDGALFDEVVRLAAPRVTVLAPVEAGMRDSVERLSRHLVDAGVDSVVTGAVVAGAREPGADVSALVTEAAREAESAGTDLIVLGQFSLSPATAAASAAVSVPVLSAPHLAARALQSALLAETPA